MAILVAHSFRGEVHHKEAEIRGQLLTYRFSQGDLTFTVGSLYAPNEGQEKFLHNELTEATATTEQRILIGGDSNLVFNN